MFSRWTEQSRIFTPPSMSVTKVGAGDKDFSMKIVYGFTTITLVNQRGKIKTVVQYGDQRI